MTGTASVAVGDTVDGVTVVEINRPPNNFFDVDLIRELGDTFDALAAGPTRAVVLAAAGKHFCAGMNFSSTDPQSAAELYRQAHRLVAAELPVVAAVQGAAVGGGLGLALIADFRVASSASRFSANFVSIGLHPGFGLTLTLPRLVGHQQAAELMLTGRRIDGARAHGLGLCDRLADPGDERRVAIELAGELAANAPLAVRAVKRTLQRGLVDAFAEATQREFAAQDPLFVTADFAEGVAAAAERRPPRFTGT